jgi:hypothetical protein
MRTLILASVLVAMVPILPGTARTQSRGAPETFTANLNVLGATAGAGAATIQITIERYTPDRERTAVAQALTGGYEAFLAALRRAPVSGFVAAGDQKWTIRWAREKDVPKGRTIVVITDQPIFFVGGGRLDAKPRAGYDVAVIEMHVDDVGLGKGTMAAAARVKAGGETGVQIEDYAAKPIQLVTIVRKVD